jgi:hypothetical protein
MEGFCGWASCTLLCCCFDLAIFVFCVVTPFGNSTSFLFCPNQQNQTLQQRGLGKNNIGDAGAVALADGIKVSPFLVASFSF